MSEITNNETTSSIDSASSQEQIKFPQAQASYLHRDELRLDVRNYADNLNLQIQKAFREKDVKSIEELEEAARSNRISIDELVEMENLTRRLSNITKTGDIPQEEIDLSKERLMERLKEIIPEWEEFDFTIDKSEPLDEIVDSELPFVESLLETVLPLPYKTFIENPHFLQEIIEYLDSALSEDCMEYSGLLISTIYNRSVKDLPKEEFSKINQEIDFSNLPSFSCLGYNFPGGKLTIKGDAGWYLGYGMENGVIDAENAMHFAGYKMKGGFLNLKRAQIALGSEMKGGKIYTKLAGDMAGSFMENGEVEIEYSGDNLGMGMTGGVIKVKKTGKIVGIKTESDASIFIEESYESLGKPANGKIFFQGNKISS